MNADFLQCMNSVAIIVTSLTILIMHFMFYYSVHVCSYATYKPTLARHFSATGTVPEYVSTAKQIKIFILRKHLPKQKFHIKIDKANNFLIIVSLIK